MFTPMLSSVRESGSLDLHVKRLAVLFSFLASSIAITGWWLSLLYWLRRFTEPLVFWLRKCRAHASNINVVSVIRRDVA